jgi:hypothetical protein
MGLGGVRRSGDRQTTLIPLGENALAGGSLTSVGLRPPSVSLPPAHSHPDCRSPLTLIGARHFGPPFVRGVRLLPMGELTQGTADYLGAPSGNARPRVPEIFQSTSAILLPEPRGNGV